MTLGASILGNNGLPLFCSTRMLHVELPQDAAGIDLFVVLPMIYSGYGLSPLGEAVPPPSMV